MLMREYEDRKKRIGRVMRQSGLVQVNTIPANSGGSRLHKEYLDQNLYAKDKPEGAQSQLADHQNGYEKSTYSRTKSLEVKVTLEMRQLGKEPEIIRAMERLADHCLDREDLDAQHRIGFGTSASYIDMDGVNVDLTTGAGVSLFSYSIPLTGSNTTYRNRLAGNPTITMASLEAMEALYVTQIYNNLGELMSMTPEVIWTTDDPTQVNTVKQYLQSTADISAPNAGVVNVYKSKYRHIVLPKVDTFQNGTKDPTKSKMWGLACTENSTFYLDIYMDCTAYNATKGNNGEDIETLDWTYTTAMMYGMAIVENRWITMSSGDATP